MDFYEGDTEVNGDFDFDVSGIGAAEDSSLTAGASSGEFSLTAMNESLDVGEYVLAGHNKLRFGGTPDDAPDGVAARWTRNWYVDANGGDVDVRMSFDFGFSPDDPAGDYVLLRRDGTSGDFSIVNEEATIDGNRVSFVVESVSNGYYTIGGKNITVATEDGAQPGEAALSAVFPNPFEREAQVALALERAQHVAVEVFDVAGRRVAVLHDGPLAAGEQTFTFDAADLPSGTYLIRATGNGFTATQQAVLVK